VRQALRAVVPQLPGKVLRVKPQAAGRDDARGTGIRDRAASLPALRDPHARDFQADQGAGRIRTEIQRSGSVPAGANLRITAAEAAIQLLDRVRSGPGTGGSAFAKPDGANRTGDFDRVPAAAGAGAGAEIVRRPDRNADRPGHPRLHPAPAVSDQTRGTAGRQPEAAEQVERPLIPMAPPDNISRGFFLDLSFASDIIHKYAV
jgi:hypothetical protein